MSKSKPAQIEPKHRLEIIEVTHQGEAQQVSVGVCIDYVNRHITLTDTKNPAQPFQAKQWIFGKRGVGYMQGWLDILSAMQKAIMIADSKLTDHIETEDYQKVEMAINVEKGINKSKK